MCAKHCCGRYSISYRSSLKSQQGVICIIRILHTRKRSLGAARWRSQGRTAKCQQSSRSTSGLYAAGLCGVHFTSLFGFKGQRCVASPPFCEACFFSARFSCIWCGKKTNTMESVIHSPLLALKKRAFFFFFLMFIYFWESASRRGAERCGTEDLKQALS